MSDLVATDVARGAVCRTCGCALNTASVGRVGDPPFGRQVPGTETDAGSERVCPNCDARPDGPPWRTDMLDFPTAWAIQRRGGLEHGPRCSSVAGHHPLSGPMWLCDCDAVERAWLAAGGQR